MIRSLQTWLNLCGPRALAYSVRHFGIHLSIAEAASLAAAGPSGTTMLGLKTAGESVGLVCTVLKTNYEGLRQLDKPLIAHFGHGHFVLVKTVEERNVRLGGFLAYTLKRYRFEKLWSGVVLTFRAGDLER